MLAIIGTVLLAVVIILSVAIILGAPLGEFTLGGRYKVYPRKLKAILATQLLLQLLFVIILLQLGGFIPLLFSHKITKIIGTMLAWKRIALIFLLILTIFSVKNESSVTDIKNS